MRDGLNEGFKFHNPNEKDRCGCGVVQRLRPVPGVVQPASRQQVKRRGGGAVAPFRIHDAAIPRNHFELLGLPVSYTVDAAALDDAYRELQGRVHPDRFASASEAERRVAMQWATRANEAYRTLRNPIDRARYLLGLKGFDTGEESNTSMPPDFLMQQMEWRESVEDGRGRSERAPSRAFATRSRPRAPRCTRFSPAPWAGTGITMPAARS